MIAAGKQIYSRAGLECTIAGHQAFHRAQAFSYDIECERGTVKRASSNSCPAGDWILGFKAYISVGNKSEAESARVARTLSCHLANLPSTCEQAHARKGNGGDPVRHEEMTCNGPGLG